VSHKTQIPYVAQIILLVATAVTASFFNINILANMVNIATLSAFSIVCLLVPISRKSHKIEPAFKVPFSPVLPIIGSLGCFFLLLNLSVSAWFRFLIWAIIGYVIYFCYSQKHSSVKHK
jgi:APA family basic amino acid/polyamine antiporter